MKNQITPQAKIAPYTIPQVAINVSLMIEQLQADGVAESLDGGAGLVLHILRDIQTRGIK